MEPEKQIQKIDDKTPERSKIPIVQYKRKIVWRNVFVLLLLHVIAIYYYLNNSLNPKIKWYHILLPDIFGRISGLGILAGCHRLWAHRSYKARLPLRIVLMMMQTMALQNDIYDWCRDHRVHHKYSDTDADPYNVRRGFFFSHMGWLMVKKHPEVIEKGYWNVRICSIINFPILHLGRTIDLSDLWTDPVVRFQRRFYIPLVILIWGIIPTYLTHLATGFTLIECFFGAVVFRYVYSLHCTWTVNSLAHMYGYQTYDHTLESRENQLVTYLSWGEGYHNYHHTFPWDYSASELRWTQCFNMATIFIDLCAWLGLVYDRKKVDPKWIRKRIQRTGNKHLLQNNINTSQTSILKDYFLGFLISQHLVLITWSLRILVNGSM